jgi:hypothetical protein
VGHGSGLSACPGCKEQHPDWAERLRMSLGASDTGGFSLPGGTPGEASVF